MAKRERRQRGTQYTGVLRGNRSNVERPLTQHSVERGASTIRWRAVSGVIVLCLSAVLALFFFTDVFYVRSIAVGGLQYMTKEEVFTYADIADVHAFWLEPETIRRNLMRYPTVADAEVRIDFPPNMVSIIIEEREPALIWEQNGVAVWVDVQGNVMPQRAERPDLVKILVDNPLIDGPLGESGRLNVEVVYGLLQLQGLRPEVRTWNYEPVKGIGFTNSNGWMVWFGVGTSMLEKMQIYEAISSDIIAAQGIVPGEINVADPDAPFFTVVRGR